MSPPPLSPHVTAGLDLLRLRRPKEAQACFRMAVMGDPNDVNALQLLGAALLEDGDPAGATGPIEKALRLAPAHVGARVNLGCAQFALGLFDAAAKSFQEALTAKPDQPVAHLNLGNALFAAGRRSEAALAYRKAWDMNPAFGEALGGYVHCAAHTCAWDQAAAYELMDLVEDGARIGPPFVLHSLVDDPALHLAAARRYVETKAWLLAERPRPYDHDRIRLAYVSSDFKLSPVAHLMAGVLEDHDRSRFDVLGVSLGRDDGSDLRRRMERGVDRFVDLNGTTDDQAANTIRALEADIVIDLNGHTEGARPGIFARRPAPLQVVYLGFSGTTGCPFYDYAITDSIVTPADQQPFYTETLWPLAGCYMPSDRHRAPVTARTTRAACGLPARGFVFCSFNNSYKITPEMFGVWMELLRSVPDSVLWLAAGAPEVETNLRREAANRGLDPKRLYFAPRLAELTDHLARYAVADLFLDTFPYNAATTACDALSMGLPVLTLSGRSYAARMAGSLLQAIGLNDLVTRSIADYQAAAISLATDPARLAEIKARLGRNITTTALFDADLQRRQLEDAYRSMWDRR